MNTNAVNLTIDQRMALMSMESKAKQKTSLDLFREFSEMGFSDEVISGLKAVAQKTAIDISGKVIEVGKIVIIKVIEFVKKNKEIAKGMAIGAIIGAMSAFIPFIGPLLAPLLTQVGILAGAVIGDHLKGVKSLDEGLDRLDEFVDAPIKSAIKSAMSIAKEFVALLKEIFATIFRKGDLA
jgi:hypothetical protein